jgi:uncharacterized protein HemX
LPAEAPPSNGSRSNLAIVIGLLILAIAGLAIGAASYWQKQEQSALQQAQEQRKQENEKEKEGRIGQLREQIAEINRKLQAADKPAFKDRREAWDESLSKLSARLSEIDQMSSEQLPQISQACDEISKELKKIEEEVNSLQGLLPAPLTKREPIKV